LLPSSVGDDVPAEGLRVDDDAASFAHRPRLLIGVAGEPEATVRPTKQLVHRVVADGFAGDRVDERALAEVHGALIRAVFGAALKPQHRSRLLSRQRLQKARQRQIEEVAFNH
jgi:hypothetical protein